MIQEDCIILDHKKIADKCFKLSIQSKYISENTFAGQFIDVRVTDKTIPLLRRPFSIHKIDASNNSITILYEVVGLGTELLSQKKTGETISVLGPLGNGFKTSDKKIVILVGGGMGVAPLYELAKSRVAGHELRVVVFIGAKTASSVLCEQEFKDLGCEVIVSTDDGTHGKKGLVSDILLDFLNSKLSVVSCQLLAIFSCGPHGMLKAVAGIAQQKQIGCQVSMESFMACGIGVCKGCAIKTKTGLKMACKDGPVFDAKEIIWK